MKPGSASVFVSTVREFMHIIAAQAKAALAGIERPGVLQLSRLHPTSDDLVPSRYMDEEKDPSTRPVVSYAMDFIILTAVRSSRATAPL